MPKHHPGLLGTQAPAAPTLSLCPKDPCDLLVLKSPKEEEVVISHPLLPAGRQAKEAVSHSS